MRQRTRQEPHLTLRERQVLELLTQGYHNQQIAEQLGVSAETVKTHVGSIFAKLGLASRTEAAVWWSSTRQRQE